MGFPLRGFSVKKAIHRSLSLFIASAHTSDKHRTPTCFGVQEQPHARFWDPRRSFGDVVRPARLWNSGAKPR